MTKNIPAKLDKHMGDTELHSLNHSSIRDLNSSWGGTITARYYKGIGADGDNLVLVISQPIRNRSLAQYTVQED